MRTRHGEDAFVVESNGDFTLESSEGKKVYAITQGSTLLMRDG